jgi:hypothetical protein
MIEQSTLVNSLKLLEESNQKIKSDFQDKKEKLKKPDFEYWLICAKICGAAHFNMKLKIVNKKILPIFIGIDTNK